MPVHEASWKLEESPSGWSVDPLGAEVTQLQIDFAFSMTIDQEIHVRLATPFTYFDGSAVHNIDPELTHTQAPLLGLFNMVVTSAFVAKSTDELTISFADGRWIRARRHPTFEAYSMHIPRSETPFGGNFTCEPGT
jgi:Family of unknown function (DUF6188)